MPLIRLRALGYESQFILYHGKKSSFEFNKFNLSQIKPDPVSPAQTKEANKTPSSPATQGKKAEEFEASCDVINEKVSLIKKDKKSYKTIDENTAGDNNAVKTDKTDDDNTAESGEKNDDKNVSVDDDDKKLNITETTLLIDEETP